MESRVTEMPYSKYLERVDPGLIVAKEILSPSCAYPWNIYYLSILCSDSLYFLALGNRQKSRKRQNLRTAGHFIYAASSKKLELIC